MDAKPIILVSSCVRDRHNGHNQAIRDCWGYESRIPYKFCIGDMEPEHDDEINVDCPDNYFSLAYKTQASLKWALEQGYTHMFRAFTDTFIDTERLRTFDYTQADYIGNTSYSPRLLFCHGGPGYWLSARAAQIVVDVDLSKNQYWNMEDQFVGEMMGLFDIRPLICNQFSMGQSYGLCEPMVLPYNSVITCHLSNASNKYDNGWMYQAYFWRWHKHPPCTPGDTRLYF